MNALREFVQYYEKNIKYKREQIIKRFALSRVLVSISSQPPLKSHDTHDTHDTQLYIWINNILLLIVNDRKNCYYCYYIINNITRI